MFLTDGTLICHQRKSTGVTYNINDGSVPFRQLTRCTADILPVQPVHQSESAAANNRALKLAQLHVRQPFKASSKN